MGEPEEVAKVALFLASETPVSSQVSNFSLMAEEPRSSGEPDIVEATDDETVGMGSYLLATGEAARDIYVPHAAWPMRKSGAFWCTINCK